MHALWDEFNIYYNANGAIIKPGGELKMQVAWYKSGNTNAIKGLMGPDIHNSSPKNMEEWEGWNLYRREVNQWYYQYGPGTIRDWYTEDSVPAGYVKYLKPRALEMYLGGTAYPGEHLVLYAKWSS